MTAEKDQSTMIKQSTSTLALATRPTIEQVPFYGDTLEGVRDGQRAWVVIRRVCEALGIDHSGQLAKLKRKPWASVEFISIQVDGEAQRREIALLDLDGLPMWLATIEPSRVAPHAKGKLIQFQKDAARVLRNYFLGASDDVEVPAIPALPVRVIEMQAAAQLCDAARGLLALMSPAVSPEAKDVVLAHTLAAAFGVAPDPMLPRLPEGEWLRPEQIAKRASKAIGWEANGANVGAAISALGLKGDAEHCRTIMDQKRGGDGQVACYMYDEHAVEKIIAYLAEHPPKRVKDAKAA